MNDDAGVQYAQEVGQWQQEQDAIEVAFINPPIPERGFDYRATRASYSDGDPIGYGFTVKQAIDNLKENEQ